MVKEWGVEVKVRLRYRRDRLSVHLTVWEAEHHNLDPARTGEMNLNNLQKTDEAMDKKINFINYPNLYNISNNIPICIPCYIEHSDKPLSKDSISTFPISV